MPPAPCTIGSRITAASSSRWVAISRSKSSRSPRLQRLAEARGRAGREERSRQHAPEELVHAVDRVAHRHRAEGVAVVAAAQREQARLLGRPRACQYWSAILIATSTATEPESQKNTCSSPPGVSATSRSRQLDRRLVGQAAEHDVGHAPELVSTAAVQLRVVVAVDRAPPGRHAVDQLAAVLEPDADARCALDTEERRPIGPAYGCQTRFRSRAIRSVTPCLSLPCARFHAPRPSSLTQSSDFPGSEERFS